MTFKISFHSIQTHIELSNWPQQAQFGNGDTTNYIKKYYD